MEHTRNLQPCGEKKDLGWGEMGRDYKWLQECKLYSLNMCVCMCIRTMGFSCFLIGLCKFLYLECVCTIFGKKNQMQGLLSTPSLISSTTGKEHLQWKLPSKGIITIVTILRSIFKVWCLHCDFADMYIDSFIIK